MKTTIISFFFLIFSLSLFSQSNKIEINFFKNDSLIDNKDLKIYLVIVDTLQKVVINANFNNGILTIDSTLNSIKGYKFYIFFYDNKYYLEEVCNFRVKQNYNFEIYYYDNNPTDDIKAVFKIKYSPEFGDGTVCLTEITNIDHYFEFGENLIDVRKSFFETICIE